MKGLCVDSATPQKTAKCKRFKPTFSGSDDCQCGHSLYDHYMCGSPEESYCRPCSHEPAAASEPVQTCTHTSDWHKEGKKCSVCGDDSSPIALDARAAQAETGHAPLDEVTKPAPTCPNCGWYLTDDQCDKCGIDPADWNEVELYKLFRKWRGTTKKPTVVQAWRAGYDTGTTNDSDLQASHKELVEALGNVNEMLERYLKSGRLPERAAIAIPEWEALKIFAESQVPVANAAKLTEVNHV